MEDPHVWVPLEVRAAGGAGRRVRRGAPGGDVPSLPPLLPDPDPRSAIWDTWRVWVAWSVLEAGENDHLKRCRKSL